MAHEDVDQALPRTIAPDGRLTAKFRDGEPNRLLDELCVVDGVCEPRWPGATSYEPQARQTGYAAKEKGQDSHHPTGWAERPGRALLRSVASCPFHGAPGLRLLVRH